MRQQDCSTQLAIWPYAKADWKWLLAGSIFAFFFASGLILGWRAAFFPDFHHPFAYGGDGKFIIWQIQRVIEGWIFDSPRSGYPFGSNFLDYPNSDGGSLFFLKTFGVLSGSYYAALNLYLLLGFPLIFVTSFLVLRAFQFKPAFAFAGAMLYAFTPFHLYRMYGHVYYSWYFVVPIYFYYGWKIFTLDTSLWPFNRWRTILFTLLLMIFLSSFGVYYALFGIITLLVCGFAATLKSKKISGLLLSFILSAMVVGGVGINLLPNIIHKHQQGKNTEAGHRYMIETEVYGLKIANLLFPSGGHPVEKLGSLVKAYARNFVVSETTYSSSLGFFASLGFAFLFLSIFAAALGKKMDVLPSLLAVLVLSFVLIATVGGLNVFFALFISPAIRGWNRVSIFISFACLTAILYVLQNSPKLLRLKERNNKIYMLIPLALTAIGLFDQTSRVFLVIPSQAKIGFSVEKEFINAIEAAVPPGSAIYQLPYMKFPETPPVVRLGDYEMLGGFINSKTLRWSHGGIKGREGDLFYRYLTQEPLAKQLEIIKRLGFSGIYIDRRGFADGGVAIITELNQLLGRLPTLERRDKQVVFYPLTDVQKADFTGLNAKQIMEKAGYVITESGAKFYAEVPANSVSG